MRKFHFQKKVNQYQTRNDLKDVHFKRADDVNNLITGKLALKYAGKEIDSMKAIATASQNRSLAEFQKVSYSKKKFKSSKADTFL